MNWNPYPAIQLCRANVRALIIFLFYRIESRSARRDCSSSWRSTTWAWCCPGTAPIGSTSSWSPFGRAGPSGCAEITTKTRRTISSEWKRYKEIAQIFIFSKVNEFPNKERSAQETYETLRKDVADKTFFRLKIELMLFRNVYWRVFWILFFLKKGCFSCSKLVVVRWDWFFLIGFPFFFYQDPSWDCRGLCHSLWGQLEASQVLPKFRIFWRKSLF